MTAHAEGTEPHQPAYGGPGPKPLLLGKAPAQPSASAGTTSTAVAACDVLLVSSSRWPRRPFTSAVLAGREPTKA
ncbi:hypothetical protein [Streptomyces sp. NPDC002587]